jgi:hypothetical protein
MRDKNLGQQINIEFCVKIGKSASRTLALLTVAYDEHAMKKLSVFLNGIGSSGKGKKMCKMTQELGSQKCKGQMQMWVEYEQTADQQCYLEVLTRLRESVWRKRPKLWPDKWILHHDSAPAHDGLRVHKFQDRKSIKNGPSTLFT